MKTLNDVTENEILNLIATNQSVDLDDIEDVEADWSEEYGYDPYQSKEFILSEKIIEIAQKDNFVLLASGNDSDEADEIKNDQLKSAVANDNGDEKDGWWDALIKIDCVRTVSLMSRDEFGQDCNVNCLMFCKENLLNDVVREVEQLTSLEEA